jgi:hypothetical protein
MLGFGNPTSIAQAQDLATEELKILNPSLVTLRAKFAAKRAK